jgi:hypothetical protein
MYCPQCKAEYREGFTRCSDCDVDLVDNYARAARHPLAKKLAVGDEYGARLWHGANPHFYVGLLWSLWNKNVACYGVPEYPPIPESVTGPQSGNSEPGDFEVWVSRESVPIAKWILDSAREDFEKEAPEEGMASVEAAVGEVSPGTTFVCPLCFGEFTTASLRCPNCGVSLNSPQAAVAAEDSACELSNLPHPNYVAELRKALHAAGIPYNNATVTYGDFISGRRTGPNYEVRVLKRDFGRATQVMSQVLQHWEFEPSAGFGMGKNPLLDYWAVRATDIGWLPQDISKLVWSGQSISTACAIGRALQEHEIAYRVETEQCRAARILVHPDDEAPAKQLVEEVIEGPGSEG